MTDFLPKDYKEPVISNYMKFVEGDNRFRVLASAVVGWEYWTQKEAEDGSLRPFPTRVNRQDSIPLSEVIVNQYGNLNMSFFWAFPVYNFNAEKIQILVVTQTSVRQVMQEYVKNPKWGDPKKYDFVVNKDSTRKSKMYSVSVEPKETLDESITKQFESMQIDMEAWFGGEDPFVSNKDDSGSNNQVIDPNEVPL